jgi:lipopolysaccharide assembly protein A
VLRLIIAVPLIVVLVIFAVSNRQMVAISFLGWETSAALSVAVLLASAVFFLLGALVVWFGELRQRRRARRAEAQVRALETQLAEARTTLAPPHTAAMPVGVLPP